MNIKYHSQSLLYPNKILIAIIFHRLFFFKYLNLQYFGLWIKKTNLHLKNLKQHIVPRLFSKLPFKIWVRVKKYAEIKTFA